MSEVITAKSRDVQSQPLLAMIERLAVSPDFPVDKLRELLDMQLKVRAQEAEREYSEDMAKVQAALPVVLKDAYNEQTRSPYATLSAIADAIKPVYTRFGFSLSFSEAPPSKPEHIKVRCTVRHAGGHKDETPFIEVAVDQKGMKGNDNKTLTHAEGSSFTYARRYLTCMVFDVATGVDDDGNAARGGESVTAEQSAELKAYIEKAGASAAAFLRWLNAESFESIRAKDYQRASVQAKKLKKAESQ